jgi:hypothetical protein
MCFVQAWLFYLDCSEIACILLPSTSFAVAYLTGKDCESIVIKVKFHEPCVQALCGGA